MFPWLPVIGLLSVRVDCRVGFQRTLHGSNVVGTISGGRIMCRVASSTFILVSNINWRKRVKEPLKGCCVHGRVAQSCGEHPQGDRQGETLVEGPCHGASNNSCGNIKIQLFHIGIGRAE